MQFTQIVLALASIGAASATLDPATSNTKGQCPSTYNCSGTHSITTMLFPGLFFFFFFPSSLSFLCMYVKYPLHIANRNRPSHLRHSHQGVQSHPSRRVLPQHAHKQDTNVCRLRHGPQVRHESRSALWNVLGVHMHEPYERADDGQRGLLDVLLERHGCVFGGGYGVY